MAEIAKKTKGLIVVVLAIYIETHTLAGVRASERVNNITIVTKISKVEKKQVKKAKTPQKKLILVKENTA